MVYGREAALGKGASTAACHRGGLLVSLLCMGRLRVCQLVTELGPAGAERGVYELARRLDRRRFDVRVIALRGGQVADWLAEAGVPATVLGIRGKWDFLKLGALATCLRRGRIDLLHTHLFHADLAGRLAAVAAGVPHLVHTVWTAEGRFLPWQFAWARLTAGWCDRIICLAESVRRHHARRSGLPARRYAVIPWGIDAAAFAPAAAARRRLRAEWGLDDAHPLAAFVGRLESYKGIDVLLAAASHLAARGRPIHLVIAGDGPRRAIVENFIAHGEGGRHARLLGFIPDVRGVLSAADLFVMPSLWEGWGLAMGEAMAAGLPAVATDVPGLRELVVPGQTGLVVERGDSVQLADAIEGLADDRPLRRRMGQAARQRIASVFPLDATIRAHEKLYDEIVGHGPRAEP